MPLQIPIVFVYNYFVIYKPPTSNYVPPPYLRFSSTNLELHNIITHRLIPGGWALISTTNSNLLHITLPLLGQHRCNGISRISRIQGR